MNKNIILLLRISCFCVLIGRAYQFIFWDAPFRTLLWDQKLIEPLINLLGYSWKEYANSLRIDSLIKLSIKLNGIFFFISAFLVLFSNNKSKNWMKTIIWLSGISLIILALLQTKEKFYHLAMFFEHSIQFSLPFLLIYFTKTNNYLSFTWYLKTIIALTFTCHGLYAIGCIYPLPANFVTMSLNTLPLTETQVKYFLFIAGILDFIIAIGIFIPKLYKPILMYAIFWGSITAIARIASGLTYDVSINIFHQYLYQTIYRVPHGIAPIILLYLTIKYSSFISPQNNILSSDLDCNK
ncbi:hypothetical protein [Pseudofulvibacter geojedonensis]|uniref:Transmembrane protein n=1 Tax=Pseudofulvibacter geojedonensis TaxID=1123758 RepID=A0ABW3HYN4_9FLAO